MSILSDAIIAQWKMNDNAANAVVLDSSGNGHHGATQIGNTDAVAIAGKMNGALALDDTGVGEYIDVPDHADFNFHSGGLDLPFSISAWVFIIDNTKQIGILQKGHGVGSQWRLVWGISPSKMRFVCHENGNSAIVIGRKYTATSIEGAWLYLVGTYDGRGTSAGFKLYLNNVQVDDGNDEDGVYTGMGDEISDLRMGEPTFKSPNYMRLDNVILFNKELTVLEISYLWNGGNGREAIPTAHQLCALVSATPLLSLGKAEGETKLSAKVGATTLLIAGVGLVEPVNITETELVTILWVSPTNHVDPDSDWESPETFNDVTGNWLNEENAYDENTGSFAYQPTVLPSSWSGQIWFYWLDTQSRMVDKIRFWIDSGTSLWIMDMRVYANSGGILIWEGNPSAPGFADVWQEKDIPGGAQLIYNVTFEFYSSSPFPPAEARLGEVDFNVVDWGAVDPANVYDDNIVTYDGCIRIAPEAWGGFLELTHAALLCSKVRYYIDPSTDAEISLIDIDVYYDGSWHHVYEGAFTEDEWIEKDIPDGPIAITAMRINFYNGNANFYYDAYLAEVAFGNYKLSQLVCSVESNSILSADVTSEVCS